MTLARRRRTLGITANRWPGEEWASAAPPAAKWPPWFGWPEQVHPSIWDHPWASPFDDYTERICLAGHRYMIDD
jgi:hypothetical protein